MRFNNYGDLRNLLQWPLEKFAEFDLLEGGFPFSLRGRDEEELELCLRFDEGYQF